MKSVICQTLKDIEILAVDAGSTDGTMEILESYVKKDSRITLIRSDRKSYGYQLNIGIAAASGEYIGIVETDDIIAENMFELLYDETKHLKVDYVKGTAEGFYDVPNLGIYKFLIAPFIESENMTNKVIIPKNIPELFIKDNFLWYGIYRRDFLQNIRLNETPGAAFQDIGALFKIISSAQNAVYIMNTVYGYRQDNMGASSYNVNGFKYLIHEYEEIFKCLERKDKEWKTVCYKKMFFLCMDRIRFMIATKNNLKNNLGDIEYIKHVLEQVKTKGVLSENNFSTKDWKEFELFLESPEMLFRKYNANYEQKIYQIRKIINGIRGKEIIIFGIGNLGKFIYMKLKQHGVKNILAYCDNNKNMHGKLVYDLEVLSPEQAIKQYPNAYFVIANMHNSYQIKKQLENLGIGEQLIFSYTLEADVKLFFADI